MSIESLTGCRRLEASLKCRKQLFSFVDTSIWHMICTLEQYQCTSGDDNDDGGNSSGDGGGDGRGIWRNATSEFIANCYTNLG